MSRDCLRLSLWRCFDCVYDYLGGLNPKFDLVHGRILGHRSISSFMEVCYKVSLEEDCISAMNIVTLPAIDSAAFSAKFSSSFNDKKNRKPVSVCEHCTKPWQRKKNSQKLYDRPPNGKKRPPNDKHNFARAF